MIVGKCKLVPDMIDAALAEGASAEAILNEALIAAMGEVGRQFECNAIYVPEMLVAAKAMQAGLEALRPHLVQESIGAAGEVVVGTVQGDLHDIGKNLVKMMFEGAGFRVVDLGVDVAPAAFVAAVSPATRVVAMSALLTTTMPKMAETVSALKEAGIRQELKVIAGGAPVTQEFISKIGADGYASNAAAAVDLAKALMRK